MKPAKRTDKQRQQRQSNSGERNVKYIRFILNGSKCRRTLNSWQVNSISECFSCNSKESNVEIDLPKSPLLAPDEETTRDGRESNSDEQPINTPLMECIVQNNIREEERNQLQEKANSMCSKSMPLRLPGSFCNSSTDVILTQSQKVRHCRSLTLRKRNFETSEEDLRECRSGSQVSTNAFQPEKDLQWDSHPQQRFSFWDSHTYGDGISHRDANPESQSKNENVCSSNVDSERKSAEQAAENVNGIESDGILPDSFTSDELFPCGQAAFRERFRLPSLSKDQEKSLFSIAVQTDISVGVNGVACLWCGK